MCGVVGLRLEAGCEPVIDVVQCSDHVLLSVLGALHTSRVSWPLEVRVHLAMERFVVGQRSVGLNAPMAAFTTREAVARLRAWSVGLATLVERRAADVKPWATDERLDAVGLLEPTKGMRHARDAARHALFCAVKECGRPDPLSRKAGAR